MRIRPFLPSFFIALLISSWPVMLHADPVEQLAHDPYSGSFMLVATHQMTDPRFHKAVLLVTQHGKTGPIGVIVNRPQEITLDKLFPEYPAASDFSLFYGGPVYPRQVSYLVRGGDAVEGTLTISRNIYLAFNTTVLGELFNGKRRYTNLRVMHGVASWAPGQLEYEIKLGAWDVIPLDDAVIFDRPPAEMWQELHDRANHFQII